MQHQSLYTYGGLLLCSLAHSVNVMGNVSTLIVNSRENYVNTLIVITYCYSGYSSTWFIDNKFNLVKNLTSYNRLIINTKVP